MATVGHHLTHDEDIKGAVEHMSATTLFVDEISTTKEVDRVLSTIKKGCKSSQPSMAKASVTLRTMKTKAAYWAESLMLTLRKKSYAKRGHTRNIKTTTIKVEIVIEMQEASGWIIYRNINNTMDHILQGNDVPTIMTTPGNAFPIAANPRPGKLTTTVNKHARTDLRLHAAYTFSALAAEHIQNTSREAGGESEGSQGRSHASAKNQINIYVNTYPLLMKPSIWKTTHKMTTP